MEQLMRNQERYLERYQVRVFELSYWIKVLYHTFDVYVVWWSRHLLIRTSVGQHIDTETHIMPRSNNECNEK